MMPVVSDDMDSIDAANDCDATNRLCISKSKGGIYDSEKKENVW